MGNGGAMPDPGTNISSTMKELDTPHPPTRYYFRCGEETLFFKIDGYGDAYAVVDGSFVQIVGAKSGVRVSFCVPKAIYLGSCTEPMHHIFAAINGLVSTKEVTMCLTEEA